MNKFRGKARSLIIGLAGIVLLTEIILRFAGGRSPIGTGNGPSLGREKKGFYTVLCLGDSYTFGLGVSRKNSYPGQLEKLLNAAGDGRKYLVINKAVAGENSQEMIKELDRDIERIRPDAVVVLIGKENYRNFTGYGDYLRERSLFSRIGRLMPELRSYCLLEKLWYKMGGMARLCGGKFLIKRKIAAAETPLKADDQDSLSGSNAYSGIKEEKRIKKTEKGPEAGRSKIIMSGLSVS